VLEVGHVALQFFSVDDFLPSIPASSPSDQVHKMAEKSNVVRAYSGDTQTNSGQKHPHQHIEHEEEPSKTYEIGLKTWLAVLALALSTSSAVVATTVSRAPRAIICSANLRH
jgi:hypothetical protein